MKFTLKRLTLENFKGQSTDFQFSNNTFVFGENGSGKTTQYDAFMWLLFGKDSQSRKDYNIKPRLRDGTEVQQTDVSVGGEFEINEQPLSLKRIYHEKWETKKGEDETRFTGNETMFEINGVPCNLTNYKKQIDSIINEELFKMVTSTSYFNETLKWTDRKAIILKLAGEPTNEEIAGQSIPLLNLLRAASGKDLAQFRLEISALKKPIKKQKDEIPSKIEENRIGIIEKDWTVLESLLASKREEVRNLEQQITDEGERLKEANKETIQRSAEFQNEITRLSNQKFSIEQKHKDIFVQATNKLNAEKEKLSNQIILSQSRITDLERMIAKNEEVIAKKEAEKKLLLDRYNAIQNGSLIDKICPACGQSLTEEILKGRIGQLLSEVSNTGRGMKEEIVKLQAEVDMFEKEKTLLPAKIKNFQFQLSALLPIKHHVTTCQEDEDYKAVIKQLTDKKEMLDLLADSVQQPNDLSSIKEQIAILRKEVEAINQELYSKTVIENKKKRTAELNEEYKRLSSEYADLEKLEMASDSFNKKRTTMMENKINSLFSIVKWMMYKPQINGGEEEFWECSIDGVPYSSLNTANRINASLDIINTFSKVYETFAPIFIDGRESVTEIIPVETQVISLVVSPEHKTLTIK